MPEAALHSTRHRWRQAQAASDQVWTIVRPQALYQRPVPERHRLIFYLGHLEAFDWNLLAPILELPAFHAEWDRLFAFGIDPVDGQLPHDVPRDWPGVAEVMAYNREVRDKLDDALETGGGPPAAELDQRLQVALEHRWMHVETLSYLLHNLDYESKHGGPAGRSETKSEDQAVPAGPVVVGAGTATLGQPRHRDFGWDNEFDEHQVAVPEFEADRYKVSNGEYLNFVEAGAPAPHFWLRRANQWYYRGMFGEIALPLDRPVYVTQEQAAAFAAWAGKALPSEAQWHRMAYSSPEEGTERRFPWGEEPPTPHHGNFNLVEWDPVGGARHPAGVSGWGVADLLGNGWEWTRTPFEPFPGFVPFAFYPGYSANFFDGKHYVIKGASARTAECFLRRSFRNWFQPNYPYVYAGFRCVSR